MIHKICKSLDIPVPLRAYWARQRAGEKIKNSPLFVKEGVNQILGQKTYTEFKVIQEKTLNFLSEHERQKVLLEAEQIQLSDEKARLHKKIRTYHSIVKEWKNNRKEEGAQRSLESI